MNAPLGEAIATRLTFYTYSNAGFIDSVGTKPKEDANTEDTDGVRLQVLWNVTDDVSLHGYYIRQNTEVGDVGRPQSTWAVTTETDIHNVRIDRMDLDDPKRQFLEPGDTHESVVSLKLQWDLEPFTLSVIGANMDNHSFFERNVLWECLPDDWCPGVPVGGLSPRGLKADFHVTEGPSERDIETMEIRAVSSSDGDTFRAYAATQGRYQQSGRSLINIGESEVIGIEAMGIYAVSDNLELTLHLGWKDSEILSDQRQNYVGLPLPGSTSGIQYSILGDWAQDTALGEFRANVTFRSVPERWGHFTKDNPNDPYTMMDASVSLRRGALELSVFLDNVFDDRAIVWQTPNYPGWPSRPDVTDWRDQFVGYYAVLRPRTLALSVGFDL